MVTPHWHRQLRPRPAAASRPGPKTLSDRKLPQPRCRARPHSQCQSRDSAGRRPGPELSQECGNGGGFRTLSMLSCEGFNSQNQIILVLIFSLFCQICATRFVAPPYASWGDLDQLQQENGRCWVIAHICRLHPEYAGISDDFDEAYSSLNVGTDENVCLGRAYFHWRFCGNSISQPITITFRPTGASRSYPSEEILDSADIVSNNTHFLAVVYSAVYGGYDPIKPAVRQTVPTEFWMFTDSSDLETDSRSNNDHDQHPWIIVEAPSPQPSPRLAAKWFKVIPEQVSSPPQPARRRGRSRAITPHPRFASPEPLIARSFDNDNPAHPSYQQQE